MSSDLNEAIKQFEAVEGNLVKLERLWLKIEAMLPNDGMLIGVLGDYGVYRDTARSFAHILKTLPKIDGHELLYAIVAPEEVLSEGIDVAELGEPSVLCSYLDRLKIQREYMAEYKFHLGVKRRQLARQVVEQLFVSVDADIDALACAAGTLASKDPMPAEEWCAFGDRFKTIDALLGSSLGRPARWNTLFRHLRFGLKCDFDDIVKLDWPEVRAGLEGTLYGEDDPISVQVSDLGELVASKPTGPVTVELEWGRLTPAAFERLLFNLIDRTIGYENPTWQTHTNAPDRGRDLEVYRVQNDKLTGSRRSRVVIACKHMKSIGMGEVTPLKDQMALWDNPRVDELVLATSGRFSTDAIQWVEQHNASGHRLRIELWPGSHLERLLAERPELIAEFQLRGDGRS